VFIKAAIINLNIAPFVVFGVLFFWHLPNLKAQPEPVSGAMEQELARAGSCLVSFKNDSAIVITGNLLSVLKARGQSDTPFGIRVQLAEAEAFEQDQRSSLAMQKLLLVKQRSQGKHLWNIHARACLVMALLYEKVGRKESSWEQLELAKADIDRYKLDAQYPYFAIRRSSWERIYGDKKTALFFAREALRTAPTYHLLLEEAISHMLLNRLLPASALNERMQHCIAGVGLYRQLGDYVGCSSMFYAISQIHYQRKNFRQALAYSDSTIVAANQAIADGNEKEKTIGYTYRLRGKIYEQLGLLDSALVNVEKGYSVELALLEKGVSDKVIEIDARYQNKYKQKLIEEQELALRLKNNQLGFSVIIGLLILALAVGLYAGFRRQRKARQKLVAQNILIQNQATQLENLDAAKSRFFANVSHELRTPLTLIVGPVNTLLKGNQFSEKQTLLLKTVSRSARQLELTVKDILDLRKLEVGKMPLNKEPTALESFFRLHLDQFQSLAQWKQIHYSSDVQLAPELMADLDREKCRQVLYNLLSNAFKFTPAIGKIEVTVKRHGNRLSFQVADTGPGIHPDDLPHVFDRFFQASKNGLSSAGGTGIGLAICYEYTQLMNGDIRVESKPGEGSVFYVSWPITLTEKENTPLTPLHIPEVVELYDIAMPVGQPMSGNASAEATSNPRPTILVVEDNAGLREYICLILSDNYQVITAENGAVALQKIASAHTPFDLILSDLMMPVMDGYQLLETLKSGDATRHTPVIMLTARAEPADRLHALRIGVDDYLTKPFEEDELLVRIANLLKNQSVRRQEVLVDNKESDARPLLPETDREWLEAFERYVRVNLASDLLTVPALSETFAMSESTLLRQLKRLTGLSPVQYLQEIRLNHARSLLENGTDVSINTLASQVGYKDVRSFSRSFKNRFGKSPGDFLYTTPNLRSKNTR
jgi:signal transduction histidine kinase/DNA-binding response OmpR family regulator